MKLRPRQSVGEVWVGASVVLYFRTVSVVMVQIGVDAIVGSDNDKSGTLALFPFFFHLRIAKRVSKQSFVGLPHALRGLWRRICHRLFRLGSCLRLVLFGTSGKWNSVVSRAWCFVVVVVVDMGRSGIFFLWFPSLSSCTCMSSWVVLVNMTFYISSNCYDLATTIYFTINKYLVTLVTQNFSSILC